MTLSLVPFIVANIAPFRVVVNFNIAYTQEIIKNSLIPFDRLANWSTHQEWAYLQNCCHFLSAAQLLRSHWTSSIVSTVPFFPNHQRRRHNTIWHKEHTDRELFVWSRSYSRFNGIRWDTKLFVQNTRMNNMSSWSDNANLFINMHTLLWPSLMERCVCIRLKKKSHHLLIYANTLPIGKFAITWTICICSYSYGIALIFWIDYSRIVHFWSMVVWAPIGW